MSNIIITSGCNLSCPFCFATETRVSEEEIVDNKSMAREEFQKIAKFDGGHVTSICGGEPTTHPEFCDMVEDLLSIRFRYVHILTNGVWNDKVRNYFSSLPFSKMERIHILFNVLEPHLYKENQLEKLYASLESINPDFATIGFTIYKHSFDYSHIIKLAKRFNIPSIRYSIAAPNISDTSTWHFDPKSDFSSLAKVVYRFVTDARKEGLAVVADCGYLPPCAYEKEELAELLLIEKSVRFNCYGAPIDIAKGGDTWRCYGLYSALKTNIDGFKNSSELRDYYNKRTNLLHSITLFDDCEGCEHFKSELCGGGCYTFHIIKALKDNKNHCLFPIDNQEKLPGAIPVIHQKLKLWETDTEKIVYIKNDISRSQTLTPPREVLKTDENLLELIQMCDGKTIIEDIIQKLAYRFEDECKAKEAVISNIKYLFDRGALYFR